MPGRLASFSISIDNARIRNIESNQASQFTQTANLVKSVEANVNIASQSVVSITNDRIRDLTSSQSVNAALTGAIDGSLGASATLKNFGELGEVIGDKVKELANAAKPLTDLFLMLFDR